MRNRKEPKKNVTAKQVIIGVVTGLSLIFGGVGGNELIVNLQTRLEKISKKLHILAEALGKIEAVKEVEKESGK